MTKQDEFNQAIVEGLKADNFDAAVQNWVSTQFGMRFAGTETTVPRRRTCPVCGRRRMVTTRRLNTAYADDSQNWMTSCRECFNERFDQYAEDWDTYWSMTR